MLNHAVNSYINRRKQLCHAPDTVISHRKQLYHPLVYYVCILIRSGSRSNITVAKQSKYKTKYRIYEWCIPFYLTSFYLKMSHNIYHMSSRTTIQEYQPLGDTKALSELIFWYVNLEAI